MSDAGGVPTLTGESHRLAVLQDLHLLDTPVDPAFDALVMAAQRLMGCAVAAITLVAERQVFALASVGLPSGAASLPREHSICPHAVAAGNGFFEVSDTRLDDRFAHLPIRFYAAVTLVIDGAGLGTLCVIDGQPRQISEAERGQLEALAQVAVKVLLQHQANRALQLQIDRLMDLTRASGDWMWETDEHGCYRWISGDFERLTGLSPARCIGQPVEDEQGVDGAGDLVTDAPTLRTHLLGRAPFARIATRLMTANGPRYISRSALPVFRGQGEFGGFRGTARDVTARKQALHAQREHDALRRQIESAEQSSRDKSEFLSRVSHELRTPLNAILGFTQLMSLDSQQPLGLVQRARLDGVRQAGHGLLRIIDELLEVSLADARAPVAVARVSVEAVGGDAAAHAAPAAAVASAEGEAPTEPARPPRVVLYIEDEPLNIVLMEEIFRGQPEWVLHVARDGSEGVEMALALKPDLALIDMNLPDFNGIEVLRRLRAEPSMQGLRCIALSADAMAEQIAAARAAGFDDYWTKPIDLTRLLAAIARAIDPP